MKSWFLRLIAVFMAFVLCVAISACGKDDAGEENSLAPGQTVCAVLIKSVALHTPFASSFFAIWIILYPSGMVTFTVRDSGSFATVVLLFCCVALSIPHP